MLVSSGHLQIPLTDERITGWVRGLWRSIVRKSRSLPGEIRCHSQRWLSCNICVHSSHIQGVDHIVDHSSEVYDNPGSLSKT